MQKITLPTQTILPALLRATNAADSGTYSNGGYNDSLAIIFLMPDAAIPGNLNIFATDRYQASVYSVPCPGVESMEALPTALTTQGVKAAFKHLYSKRDKGVTTIEFDGESAYISSGQGQKHYLTTRIIGASRPKIEKCIPEPECFEMGFTVPDGSLLAATIKPRLARPFGEKWADSVACIGFGRDEAAFLQFPLHGLEYEPGTYMSRPKIGNEERHTFPATQVTGEAPLYICRDPGRYEGIGLPCVNSKSLLAATSAFPGEPVTFSFCPTYVSKISRSPMGPRLIKVTYPNHPEYTHCIMPRSGVGYGGN